jgi:hypothetical protein
MPGAPVGLHDVAHCAPRQPPRERLSLSFGFFLRRRAELGHRPVRDPAAVDPVLHGPRLGPGREVVEPVAALLAPAGGRAMLGRRRCAGTSRRSRARSRRAGHERMEAKEPGQRIAVKAASRRSRRSRSRAARALTALRWSGSGLPCDHGRTSRRARATRRYAANDGARNVDFECFLGSSGTRPLHAVPLQCHPNQCADKHLPPRRPKRHRRYYLAVSPPTTTVRTLHPEMTRNDNLQVKPCDEKGMQFLLR